MPTMLRESGLHDPIKTSALSDEALRARRVLVAATALWSMLVYLEITPTRISFLGVELENLRASPAVLAALAVQYFWINFSIYSLRDWRGWLSYCRGGYDGMSMQIARRRLADKNAEDAISTAQMSGSDMSAKVTVSWPDSTHPQEMVLGDLQRGTPYWKEQTRLNERERFYFVLDSLLRTLWEFSLPFLCGLGALGWLLKQGASRY